MTIQEKNFDNREKSNETSKPLEVNSSNTPAKIAETRKKKAEKEDQLNKLQLKIAKETLSNFQSIIENSAQNFFRSDYVRKIIEKNLSNTFQLIERSGIDFDQIFPIIKFKLEKLENIDIYNNKLYSSSKEMEEDLQNGYEHFQNMIGKLPEYILCTANYQDMIKEILMVSLSLAEKSDIDITQFFTKNQVEKILESFIKVAEKKGIDVIQFVSKGQVEQALNSQSADSKNLRLNDLGLPMHPLEVEVADLVERAKAGEQVFQKYERVKYGDPVAYLKEYYGKYLKKYNTENEDFLYQFQLQAIDPKFRNNLRMYLSNHGQDINDFVPKISMKSDMEARKIVEAGIHNLDKSIYKINNLAFSRKLRTG